MRIDAGIRGVGPEADALRDVQSVDRTVYDTVRVKKKVFYWKWVKTKTGKKRVKKSKYIWVTKQVARTVTEQVPGPSVACYGSGQPMPAEYGDYRRRAGSDHARVDPPLRERVGYRVQTEASAESRAECFGMQMLPPWATTLGADADDARAIGKYYYEAGVPEVGHEQPVLESRLRPQRSARPVAERRLLAACRRRPAGGAKGMTLRHSPGGTGHRGSR